MQEHKCTAWRRSYPGFSGGRCGRPAKEQLDGEWLCPRHAAGERRRLANITAREAKGTMPRDKEKREKEKPDHQIVAELVITERRAAELLNVDRETHWFRVIHEVTRDAAPWAVVRLQAIKR